MEYIRIKLFVNYSCGLENFVFLALRLKCGLNIIQGQRLAKS